MINVVTLQQKIIDEPRYIIQILEALGHENIRDRGKYITFSNIGGDNLSACSILKATLQYQNYSHGENGNLFTLVMSEKGLNFGFSLRWISNEIGISSEEIQGNVRFPFSGFYKSLQADNDIYTELPAYSSDQLPTSNSVSKKFFDDNIAYDVQEKLGIRYDHDSDSILIPIHDINGRLVGCKARRNSDEDFSARWYAYLSYQKTKIVYGLYENYYHIINKKTLIIFESEKSVAQCISFGFYNCVAVAGHNISNTQAEYIKSLMCEKIIIAYDEGINEDCLIFEANKLLVNNRLYKNNVGYIYDDNHEYLLEGSKDSPSDNGKNIFKKLLRKVRWLNGKSSRSKIKST